MTRCHAHVTYDQPDYTHRCRTEAARQAAFCYYHDKVAAGLCEPDYDTLDEGQGGVQPEGIRHITDTRDGRTLWMKETA